MTKSLIAVTVATLATAGCQTWGPEWSELSGSREFNKTTMFLKPALIESVDGQSAYAAYPIKLEPGTHNVTVQGPYRQRGGGLLDTITINMEPCKRYYVNTQFNNFVRPTFEPVVDHVEDVAGCGSSSPKVAAK